MDRNEAKLKKLFDDHCEGKYCTRESAFIDFDYNGSGDLSFMEFEEGCKTLLPDIFSHHDIKVLFRMFDRNGDGNIDKTEFRGMHLVENPAHKLDTTSYEATGVVVMDEEKQKVEATSKTSYVDQHQNLQVLRRAADFHPDVFFMCKYLLTGEMTGFENYGTGAHHRGFPNMVDAFNHMDGNGNGSLSRSEFDAGLISLGFKPNTQLFNKLDIDGSGEISLAEMSLGVHLPTTMTRSLMPAKGTKYPTTYSSTDVSGRMSMLEMSPGKASEVYSARKQAGDFDDTGKPLFRTGSSWKKRHVLRPPRLEGLDRIREMSQTFHTSRSYRPGCSSLRRTGYDFMNTASQSNTAMNTHRDNMPFCDAMEKEREEAKRVEVDRSHMIRYHLS